VRLRVLVQGVSADLTLRKGTARNATRGQGLVASWLGAELRRRL